MLNQTRHVLLKIVLFLVAVSFAWGLILISPVGKPAIHITVETSSPGFSQMFFAEQENDFSEDQSRWQPLTVGQNEISFPFGPWRGTLGNYQRWDPVDQPASLVVKRLYLAGWFHKQDLPLESLRPSMALSEPLLNDTGIQFSTESNDAQLLMNAELTAFYQSNFLRIGFASAVIVGIFSSLIFLYRRFFRKERQNLFEAQGGKKADRSLSPVPLWCVLGAGIYLLFVSGLLLYGAVNIGVSWDEPAYVASLQEYIRSGWFVPRVFFVDGAIAAADSFVHGPIGPAIGQVQSILFGNDAGSFVAANADSYQVRHVATALLTVIGILSVGAIAKVTSGSWRWALIGSAGLASIPLSVGYGMFNNQDIPVAVGFVLVTLALVVMGRSPGRSQCARLRSALLVAGLAGGIILSIGTRPGMWLPVLVVSGGSLVIWLLLDLKISGMVTARRAFLTRFGLLVVGAVLAYLALWIFYPVVFSDPWTMLTQSLSASTAFPWQGETLTAGMLLPAQPPWYYIPVWLLAQLPVIISVFALIGITGTTISLLRSFLAKREISQWSYLLVPVMIPTIGIPLATVVLNTTLYSGVRQLLFLIPGISLLAIAGIRILVQAPVIRKSALRIQLIWVAVSVGFIIPLIGQVTIFPYSYAYVNVATTTQPINGNWEIDGWWLSGRELLETGPLAERTVCVESAARPVADCAAAGILTPFLPIEVPKEREITLAEDEYLALNRFEKNLNNDQCKQIFAVERKLYLQSVRLSGANLCKVQLLEYPEGGISFTTDLPRSDPGLLWGENPYLLWGWGSAGSDGVTLSGTQAALGFVLNSDQQQKTNSITMLGFHTVNPEGSAPSAVYANGVQVGEIPNAEVDGPIALTFPVPNEILDSADGGRVIIRFDSSSAAAQPHRVGEWLEVSTGFKLQDFAVSQ
jgi:hypothetical protein